MQYKNTEDRYGLIAILLHWIVAFGFLASYMSVYYRHWFTEYRTPPNWTALQLHLSFGITIFVFVVLRIVWKCLNKTPKDEPGSKLEHNAAHFAHYTLYAVMIIMPLTGYFGTGVHTEYFTLFNIPKFSDTWLYQTLIVDSFGLNWQSFEPPMDFIHKKGGKYFVWVLILVHIFAAFYHHFIRKDNVLRRMTKIK
jgi:cytochrome b561